MMMLCKFNFPLKRVLSVALATTWLLGCAANNVLPPQSDKVSKLVVKQVEPDKTLLDTEDPQLINDVIDFVNLDQSDWSEGEKRGKVFFTFYQKGAFAGNFYLNEDQLGRDYGQSWYKEVSTEQLQRLSQMIDVDLQQVLASKECSDLELYVLDRILSKQRLAEKASSPEAFESEKDGYKTWCDVKRDEQNYRLHTSSNSSFIFIEKFDADSTEFFGPFRTKR